MNWTALRASQVLDASYPFRPCVGVSSAFAASSGYSQDFAAGRAGNFLEIRARGLDAALNRPERQRFEEFLQAVSDSADVDTEREWSRRALALTVTF